MNLMLENLNPEQKKAVETTEGPLLVLSGAGTGKTRVLVTRVAYILANQLAAPWQILALTFTNKAANEMKNRISDMLSGNTNFYARDLWCGTFHSICLRILRTNVMHTELKSDFIIFGEDDQKAVLKNVFTAMGANNKEFDATEWVEKISNIKDRGRVENLDIGTRTKQILDNYNAELRRQGAIDFGDIILLVLELFEKNPEVRKKYAQQFKYIMVDEFQDTNAAQMQFLKLLTSDVETPNICCVGDDDQSIYSWRGAEIRNILEFEKTFPGAKIIRLETNYRSTGNILGAANSLIRHNNGRLGKDLKPVDEKNLGDPVYVLTVPSNFDEVKLIADTILRYANGHYSDYAVLIRTGSLSRGFEETFAETRIPYRLIGTTKFYDRMEIRDVIAYIRLLVHPSDDISFVRTMTRPRRGFGPSAIAKMRAAGANLMDGLRNVNFGGKQGQTAKEFLSVFDFDWKSVSPKDAVTKLLNESGYMKYWNESKEADAEERLANIRELITNVVANYDTLPEFLEHAALMTTDENDSEFANDNQAVSVMTIHAAKGLEFDTVFLPAWEDGIFPNEKAIKEGGMEEERRLAYVAITRARRRVIITNTMSRVIFGSRQYYPPARFISEMDSRYLDFGGRAPRYNAPTQTYQPRVKPVRTTMVGKLVNHADMGRGVVIEENENILTIAFNKTGIKKVARDFIEIIG